MADDKPLWHSEGDRRSAPAASRNREAILAVLQAELPERGLVLEIASGSGEHARWYAEALPQLDWLPSDRTEDALRSAAAWQEDYSGDNLCAPVKLDAADPASWPIERADAALCINMVHIAPWEATEGLFAGAGRILVGSDAPLILYGPFFEADVEPAPSNIAFDENLRARDPRWGIREVREIDALAGRNQLTRTARHTMPANNLMLVYRRA